MLLFHTVLQQQKKDIYTLRNVPTFAYHMWIFMFDKNKNGAK